MLSIPVPAKKGTAGLLMMAALAFLLLSCGGGSGGGGGAGGGGGGSLRVTLATSSLTWAYFPGTVPTTQTVFANSSGTYSGTVYVGAVVENTGASNAINPNIVVSLNGSQATAQVTPVANLAVGTYTGRIQFLACSDAACANPIGGTPLPVPFTVTVQSPVQATPTPVSVTAVSGSPASQVVAVQPGVGETSFTATSTSSFIQIANQSGSGFAVNLPSLPSGVYAGTISLTGNLGSRATLPVTYTVQAPAGGDGGLSVAPSSSLTFSTTEGAASAPQTITVTEPTWRPGMKVPVILYNGPDTNNGWLQVTPSNGGYSVVANAASLTAGTYLATIDIQANPLPAGIADPTSGGQFRRLNVSLTVGPGLIRPADVFHEINGDHTVSSLMGTVPVNVVGGPQVTWNAVSSAPSMVAVSASGTTGGNLTYTIDANWLRNTAVNYQEYVAQITVSVPGSPHITPTQFSIFVQPRIGTVLGIGPRRVLASQATQLVVTGRGFNLMANPAARLSIPGATITNVQRVNDRKLLVDVQGLGAGTYMVSMSNGLNKSPKVESFRVLTPAVPAYATATTGTYQRMLIVDDERSAVYLLDSGHVLKRYQSVAGVWSATTVPVSNVTNAALLNNGSLLITSSTDTSAPSAPATVRILDGMTLQEVSQLAVPTGIHALDWTVPGLPVSADNKVWMNLTPVCSSFGQLGYFDPVDGTMHTLPPSSAPCPFQYGPEFAIARNGERLVLWSHLQAPTTPPNPPGLMYMDTSDQVLQSGNSQAPVISSWGNSAFSSDDGRRLVIDQARVLDEQHNLVGRLEVPYYGGSQFIVQDAEEAASIISPDGTRAYVLAFNVPDYAQPTQMKPRVYVFNTIGVVGNVPLPVLGYFEIDDYPSCYNLGCDRTPIPGISLDGRTLYFGGSERLVVVPIPQTLTSAVASPGGAAAMSIRTQPWRAVGVGP
jgi:hypothetical protein